VTDKTTDGSARYLKLTKLADEFAARYRAGQRPSLQEYIDRYPDLAAEIRELLPAMVEIEQVRDDQQHPAEPTAAWPAPAIKQLGDFRIIREVGKGGMGFVYEAEQMSLGRHVALKLLPRNMLIDAKAKRRFEREAKAAARLHHTNIVPVFGIGEQDGMPYYVMQFIEGLGLDAVLEELKKLQLDHLKDGAPADGGLRVSRSARRVSNPTAAEEPIHHPPDTACSAAYIAQSLLTGGLEATIRYGSDEREPKETGVTLDANLKDQRPRTKDHGLILEPAPSRPAVLPDSFSLSGSSISVPGGGRDGSKSKNGKRTYWQSVALIGAQVADALEYAHKQGFLHRDIKPSNLLLDKLGTAWVTDFGLAKAVDDQQNLTHTGDILGTLRYMSPEAFEGKTDAKSDIYSLGLTLYELLAFRPAFAERERNRLIRRVTNDEPERLDRLNPRVPRDLVTVVHKAIERDPQGRYTTAGELARDLERFIDDEPILAQRQTQLERFVRWARHNRGIAALGAALTAVLVAVTIGSVFVAGRMTRLANEAAQKAAGEREERAKAELAQQAAESSFAKARAAEQKGRRLLYTTDMQLAPFVWKDDRSTAEQLRVLLAKHIPDETMKVEDPGSARHECSDLRGFEWYYYQNLLEESAAVFSELGPTVVAGAFTNDGQLVTLDENSQLRRWDVDSQREDEASRRNMPFGSLASARALSPDGRLAAIGQRNKVHVFDATTGKETFSIDSADTPYRRALFSRNADWLVIVDDKIRWLSATNGEVIASFEQDFDRVGSLALSADGLTLAVVGHGHQIGHQFSTFRLNATAKKVTPLAQGVSTGGTMYAGALSPDGRRMVAGGRLSAGLLIFDTATGRSIAMHPSAHASPVAAMAFSGDGAKLATADAEGTVKIWAGEEKLSSKSEAILTLKGRQGAIHNLSFSSDGKWLVTTSADSTARVWDLENAGAAIRPLERSGPSLVARFSPDGQLIACATGNSVRLWDAATARLVRELSADDNARVYSVAFSPADNRLLAVGYGGAAELSHVTLWDIDAKVELARWPGATDLAGLQTEVELSAVAALAFSPNGKYLVAGFGSKKLYSGGIFPVPLKVWEIATRRLIGRLNGHKDTCVALQFSPDGTLLASGSRDATAILWSTATWNKVKTLENRDRGTVTTRPGARGPLEDVAFSPDGKTLVLASFGGTLQLWDVPTGTLMETLKGHSGAVCAAAFSPDGRTLASGSNDHTVRLWNVDTRRELLQLDPGSVELGQVRTLAFAADGRQLVVGGDRSAAVWSAAPSVWNDPDRAALKLQVLLDSKADFQSRIQMFSENLKLHEALAKLDRKDVRVQAALAATLANWHAARQEWTEAVAAFDRLVAADPSGPDGWLRTPGLLRLATALLHHNRPAVAARLLQGGARRRAMDGVATATGDAGPGSTSPAEQERLVPDAATGELLDRLCVVVNERLAQEPRNPALFELRAELAGQWSDAKAQVADYTAAIEAIARQKPEAAAADLKRLYGRRGNAHLALRQWQQSLDDYARVVTEKTTDESLLSNQALALAEAMLSRPIPVSSDPTATGREHQRLQVVKLADPWQKLAAAYRLQGDERALDRLVERRPKLAGPIGDLFAQVPNQNWQRAVEIYSKGISAGMRTVNVGGRIQVEDPGSAGDEGEPRDALDSSSIYDPSSLLSRRARAHEALKNWDAAAADWSRAATGNPDGARLLAAFARRLAAEGQVPLAKGQYIKSHGLYERSLAAEPDNVLIAGELAQLLFDEHENKNATRWTVLQPTAMKSKGGATLTLQNDGSILAGGVNPPSDEYSIKFIVPARSEIRSIRLEAFTHESLPGLGPGRGTKGSVPGLFELVRCALTAHLPDRADLPRPLSFRDAAADHSMNNEPLGLQGRWNISWDAGKNHTSVWSVSEPITVEAGTELRSQMQFNPRADWSDQNLGRFRVALSSDRAAFDQDQKRFAAMRMTDPWGRLAAAYRLFGQEQASAKLLKRHPLAPVDMGELYAVDRDWERSIAEYQKAIADQPADGALLTKLAAAYEAAGRTREAVPYIARVSSLELEDTLLFLKLAALQAWFGQEREFAATRKQILAFVKGTSDSLTADRAAKACSILPSADLAEREAAVGLGRKAVHVGPGSDWSLLALGMAEYRSGHFLEAEAALFSVRNPPDGDVRLRDTLTFYRAMSLYRQGKKDEARTLAITAAARMRPLPKDENNPVTSGGDQDDLILWLAYKESKAMIQW
jgi:eukaryotic-like serine/threonine-protein kinase